MSLGALTGGFMEGYDHSRKSARNKLIDKALDYEIADMDEKKKANEAAYEMFGEDYASDHDFQPETYGSKLWGGIKGLFGGGDKETADQMKYADINPADAAIGYGAGGGEGQGEYYQPQDQYGVGNGQAIMTAAHGGSLRQMRKKYASGGRAIALRAGVKGFANGGRSLMPNRSLPHFADGGRLSEEEMDAKYRNLTKEERMKRSYGDYYLTEEEANERAVPTGAGMSGAKHRRGNPGVQRQALYDDTTGGGVGEFARDIGRHGAEYFDDTVKGALGGDKLIEEADAKLDKAEGAREIGRATRETGTAALTAAGETTAGFLKDVVVDNPITQGLIGFLTPEERDEKTAAVQALDKDEPVDIDGQASQPTGGTGSAGVGQTTPGATAPATGADQTGVEGPPAPEDDPIIDLSQVRGVTPQKMPNKGQKEWEKERNFYAAQAVANGRSPLDAMKAVDEKQMRGFHMYAKQAWQLLRAGNPTGAANALYAAYQYFPNGVDVKFGVHTGKDGQPVLVGMGTDEETGEAIKDGKPYIINAESLATQIENFSDPAAFRAWTKDWRDMEHKLRKYEELDKPEAENMARYRNNMGKAALNRAMADLRSARSNPYGLKMSDYNSAYKEFVDSQDLRSLEDEPLAQDLADVMSRLYLRSPQTPFPSIIKMVMAAHNAGALDEMTEKYGLQ